MKPLFLILLITSILTAASAQTLPGFKKSIWFGEQVLQINEPAWAPEVTIQVNAPSVKEFNPRNKIILVLFATPNGNTIEQTIGNTDSVKADWHYNIQHIGAQTRFLRKQMKQVNLVVCYLQAKQKSWGSWRAVHPDNQIRILVDSIRAIFREYKTEVCLNGHSGGGNFVFGFINSYDTIPGFVKRIAFLDSDYAYDDKPDHGKKLVAWLKNPARNNLCVLAYNDSIALYNGKPFVSATGGTWYRSKRMADYLKNHFALEEKRDTSFIRFTGLDGRITMILKENSKRAVLHTIQVERNGFVHSMLSGTRLQEKNYRYYPQSEPFRCYEKLIQKSATIAGAQFPEKPRKAISGSAFMKRIDSLPYPQREALVLAELKKGNFPDFLRHFADISFIHDSLTCKIQVLPDYLAIGNNRDFCRIPMTPQTAQAFADFTGSSLTTSRIADTIWQRAYYKLSPVNYIPNGHNNEQVWMWVRHQRDIEKQLAAAGGGRTKQVRIVDGIKKDVVICNALQQLPGKVAIYGWYRPGGIRIQPLYTGHINWYVDYSHGIRLVNSLVWINGVPMDIRNVLNDPRYFSLLSAEPEPMKQPWYIY
jgi:hypothetical protein